jgi:uncharacterized membrane protein
MLIPFPIAFFVAVFVLDVVFWRTHDPYWASVSLWLLGAGIVMALLAAVAGLTDFAGDRRIRQLNAVWWHAGSNVLMVQIQIYNWYSRYSEGQTAILPTGLILSLVVVGLLLFAGWKGWQMVYVYHVGASDDQPSADVTSAHRTSH